MASRKSWLEMLLKRKSFNDSTLEVIAVGDASTVVGKGENYLSEIERVKATVLLGSGRTKKVSLIIKNQHKTEQMLKLSLELGVFFREITMYRDILPKMEDLLDEINDPEGIMWGRCYDYRLYNQIVFEDLNASGYRMADRKKQLGLQSALLVVKNLAKFHALSKILLDRGEIPMDIFGTNVWVRTPEITIKMITDNAERLLNVMKAWGDEWQEAAERFQKAIPSLGQRFIDALTVKADEFSVLCHGDCWTNNMLFKGEDLENPTSVKFVDMQLLANTTPAFDFHIFVGSSVRADVIKNHYDDLVRQYSNSQRAFLAKLDYKGDILSYEETKDVFAKKCILMIGFVLLVGCTIVNDTSNDPSMEEMIKREAEAKAEGREFEPFNPYKNLNEGGINMFKSCIRKCLEFELI